jgi:hypothetical protein
MKYFKNYTQFVNESGFHSQPELTEREYSDEERAKLADKGFALPDGSYPIKDVDDLKNAIQAYGRAKNQAATAKHIVKRAKALGAEDLVPTSEDFQKSLKEALTMDAVNEGRSIEKIQYDWTKLTTSMQATASNWKAAEGKTKDMLLGKLKDMTAKRKQLEAELDAAIADKDKDLELVIQEGTFYRLPKDVIGNELYVANQSMSSLYSGASAGNDISPKEIDYIIKLLQQVKSLTKKFNKADDVIGTVYEKLNVDIVAKKWDELYGEDLKDDYYDIWKKLKAKGSFTLSDLEKMWDKSYGESFKDEYDGLYKELMNESLVTEGKTDAIYNFTKEIYDAWYWKENQGKIIANFKKI